MSMQISRRCSTSCARSATVGLAGTDAATLTSFYDECLSRGMIPLARTVVDGARKKLNEDFPDAGLSRKYRETVLAVVGHVLHNIVCDRVDGAEHLGLAVLPRTLRAILPLTLPERASTSPGLSVMPSSCASLIS